MRQVDVATSVGYALKRTATALRAHMDAALRPVGLSVPQYVCLELMADQPGSSNAELARGTFVSRQAMHQLLSGLVAATLVDTTGRGRGQRFTLTAKGEHLLTAASTAIAGVEEEMLSGLSAPRRRQLRADLDACTQALAAATDKDPLPARAAKRRAEHDQPSPDPPRPASRRAAHTRPNQTQAVSRRSAARTMSGP